MSQLDPSKAEEPGNSDEQEIAQTNVPQVLRHPIKLRTGSRRPLSSKTLPRATVALREREEQAEKEAVDEREQLASEQAEGILELHVNVKLHKKSVNRGEN